MADDILPHPASRKGVGDVICEYLPHVLIECLMIAFIASVAVLAGVVVDKFQNTTQQVQIRLVVPSDLGQSIIPGSVCPPPTAANICSKLSKLGMVYGSYWLLLVASSLITGVFSAWILWGQPDRFIRYSAILLAVVSTSLYVVRELFFAGPRLYASVGRVSDNKPMSVFDAVLSTKTWDYKHLLNLSLDVANMATVTSCIVVFVTCCALFFSPPEETEVETEEQREQKLVASVMELSRRMSAHRMLITLAAVILTIGIADSAAYLAWPTAFIVEDASQQAYKTLTDGIVLVQGTEYSLMIALVYAVPAAFLHRQALTLAKTSKSATSLKAFLKDNGLEATLPAGLGETLKVAAPLIAGLLANLFGSVPSG